MSLRYLPDSLLQTIHSYLDDYDQRVFVVLSSGFVRLGEGISIVEISSKLLLKSLHSKRWRNIENGYNRIKLEFPRFYDINEFQDFINHSYEKRMEEEAREGRQLPAPSERLYEMVMEIWPFTSLLSLSMDLHNVVFLLEKNKLIKIQRLKVSCRIDEKEAVESSITRLFNLFGKNQLELKELKIIRNAFDEDEDMQLMPRLPYFPLMKGLLNLSIQGFIIPEHPGDGFKWLNQLEFICVVVCNMYHFDGVGRLILKFCRGIRELSALKITRNIHIHGFLDRNDSFYTASHLEVLICKDMGDLSPYRVADTLKVEPSHSGAPLILPEKLSDEWKILGLKGFGSSVKPLPPNKLKIIEFEEMSPQHLLPSLSNIEQVRFLECQPLSLESLASGIKDITISLCPVEDYSPLGRYEKVTLFSCKIPHTLKLSEVKELTIHHCKFTFNEESSDASLVPFLSECPKLEVLDVDFSYFNRYEMIASEFPSLKKMVLRGVDGENVDMDLVCFSGFRKCLMPRPSRSGKAITYLLRE